MDIELHGVLIEAAGRERVSLALDSPVAVATVIERLADELPALAPHLSRVACAVDDTLVPRGASLDGDRTLVLLPPVSGG